MFKAFDSKIASFAIVLAPFFLILLQIVIVYFTVPFIGVSDNLGYFLVGLVIICFILSIFLVCTPSLFKPIIGRSTYESKTLTAITLVIFLIAFISSLQNAYEIYREYGVPLTLLPGGEEVRLSSPLNKYVNLLQSFWFVALPLVILNKRKFLLFLLVGSVIIYSFFVGSRGAILYLFFVAAITMKFSMLRMFSLVGLAVAFMLSKSFLLNISMLDYFVSLMSSQAQVLNSYMLNIDDRYYGWFTFVRLFGPLVPGDQLSLIDLQYEALGFNYDGLFVASAYIYPYLDFGLLGVFLILLANLIISIFCVKYIRVFPVFCLLILFGQAISFYDSLFNQLFFYMLLFVAFFVDLAALRNNPRCVR